MTLPRLILASASPRRLALLGQIGFVPALVEPAEIDETPHKDETPIRHAERLALEKAARIAERYPDAWVLAADTVVACGRRILPKPADAVEARRCLELLSGRRHRVHGGVALLGPDSRRAQRRVVTAVAFKRLSEAEIAWYLASEEWRDKAGGYAIQGRAARFVRELIGSYSNVVGLPLFETAQLLTGWGLQPAP